jgi:hypothetical protein
MGSKEGVIKIAAKRVGLPLHEYCQKIKQGQKWCTRCKGWKPIEAFGLDSSRSDGRAILAGEIAPHSKKHKREVKPCLGRGRSGLPFRVDQIKCLGNAVDWLQARTAFEILSGIRRPA